MTSEDFPDPVPKRSDEVMGDLLRENERLRRQVSETARERDEFKSLYMWELARNADELTAEDLATAVPAMPMLEAAIKRLEQP